MKLRISSPRRAAFTMIELLVVIAILAVMVALLTSAVHRVRVVAKRTKAVTEMAQLSDGISAFETQYRVQFIPSSITLRERMDYGAGDPSLRYLKMLWPQLPAPPSPGVSPFPAGAGIDWNGDGAISQIPITLEGDQCLVFFLGGIPVASGGGVWTEGIPGAGTQGFGSNPSNPSTGLGGATKRFFNFESNRLVKSSNLAGQNGFYSYADPFGTPYAFFSSSGTKNGYNNSPGSDCPTVMAQFNVAPANTPLFTPYKDSSGAFIQPTGFQIVCAGAKGNIPDTDGGFGVGGLLQAGQFSDNGTQPDYDNVTSFFGGQLSGYGINN